MLDTGTLIVIGIACVAMVSVILFIRWRVNKDVENAARAEALQLEAIRKWRSG